jgi:hypothetical protein
VSILKQWFTYHKPTQDQQIRYTHIREGGLNLAQLIIGYCPNSPEKEEALKKLREVVMWANASIACNEPNADTVEDKEENHYGIYEGSPCTPGYYE